jgi:tetratricopeptide (TPR) repeat protein
LETLENALGSDHPRLAGLFHNLASVERARGRFSTAEPYARRSIEIAEQAVRKEGIGVSEGVYALAGILHQQGRVEEARPLYEQALGQFIAAFGTDDPRCIACRESLRSLS